jgi:galactose-1-phosphate uridylyltransferase
MTKKIILATLTTLALSSTLIAKPNMEKSPEGIKKLATIAGEVGPYFRGKKENFPKDYFLVSKNLPYLVGVALFHPQSDTLNLKKEQLEKLKLMKKTIVPISVKLAKEVKSMELELAKKIVKEGKAPESLNHLVEKIAKTKADMTKAHLHCIYDVQNILSKEQFDILIKLVSHK